jgi:hypothetical protein
VPYSTSVVEYKPADFSLHPYDRFQVRLDDPLYPINPSVMQKSFDIESFTFSVVSQRLQSHI